MNETDQYKTNDHLETQDWIIANPFKIIMSIHRIGFAAVSEIRA